MIRIDEQVKLFAQQFYEVFGEQLPLRMLPQTMTNDMLCEAVNSCIERRTNDILSCFSPEAENDDILI